MALRPEDRYASPSDLSADVERWLADEPVSSYREPVFVRVRRWGRRHRTAVTSAAVLCVTALIGLSVGYVLLSREQKRTEDAIRSRANAQLDALMLADASAVPTLLEGLEPVRKLVQTPLRNFRYRSSPRWQTRASLALLAEDPGQVEFLRQRLLAPDLDPEECLLLRGHLEPASIPSPSADDAS